MVNEENNNEMPQVFSMLAVTAILASGEQQHYIMRRHRRLLTTVVGGGMAFQKRLGCWDIDKAVCLGTAVYAFRRGGFIPSRTRLLAA